MVVGHFESTVPYVHCQYAIDRPLALCKHSGMPTRSSSQKRPKDINQLAAAIVAESTGEREKPKKKNPAAVALGKLGGAEGGLARALKLTQARRLEIAQKAAMVRWQKAKGAK